MSYNVIEKAQRLEKPIAENSWLKTGFNQAFQLIDEFPIANAADSSKAFNKGFDLLLEGHRFLYGNQQGYEREMQYLREGYKETGINEPEIRLTVFKIM